MKLCLGTVQFGLDYGIAGATKPDIESSIKILNYAYENGIRDFDTACAYGTAEVVVGEFLKRLGDKSKEIKITTKSKPNCLDEITPENYLSVFESNLDESLERLNLNQVECFMIHTADYVFNQKAIESLIELKKTGKTKKVGISIYTSEQALEALKYEDLDDIQLPYNIADNRLEKVKFFENKKNKFIYSRSAFLQGLLLMNSENIPDKFTKMKKMMNEIDELCNVENVSKLDLCLSYLNQNGNIDYMVFGVDNKPQLEEILNANFNLDIEIIKKAKQIFNDIDEFTLNPSLWNK